MFRNQALALCLVIGGVLANNYIYLHDLVMGRFEGAIRLGAASAIAIALSLVVILVGILLLVRGPGPGRS